MKGNCSSATPCRRAGSAKHSDEAGRLPCHVGQEFDSDLGFYITWRARYYKPIPAAFDHGYQRGGYWMIRCRFTNISMRRITLLWGVTRQGERLIFVERT